MIDARRAESECDVCGVRAPGVARLGQLPAGWLVVLCAAAAEHHVCDAACAAVLMARDHGGCVPPASRPN